MRGRADRVKAVAAAGAAALAVTLAGSALAATSAGPVIVKDPRGDAPPGGLDLTRVQLGRAARGTLRGALTLAGSWTAKTLPSGDGPPGALCLRLWTTAKPGQAAPDRLVCVFADAAGRKLLAVVYRQGPEHLQKVSTASVSRPSGRTALVTFPAGAIGGPAKVRFQGEADSPGCARVLCVDTAPNAGGTAVLTLRHPR
jgi:hypothetical protein